MISRIALLETRPSSSELCYRIGSSLALCATLNKAKLVLQVLTGLHVTRQESAQASAEVRTALAPPPAPADKRPANSWESKPIHYRFKMWIPRERERGRETLNNARMCPGGMAALPHSSKRLKQITSAEHIRIGCHLVCFLGIYVHLDKKLFVL